MSISVEWGDSPDRFTVAGRGELQLAVLIEQMRREGYEFQVSMPQVITQTDEGKVLEPYETLVADMPKECSGTVIRMLGGKGVCWKNNRPEGYLYPPDLYRSHAGAIRFPDGVPEPDEGQRRHGPHLSRLP